MTSFVTSSPLSAAAALRRSERDLLRVMTLRIPEAVEGRRPLLNWRENGGGSDVIMLFASVLVLLVAVCMLFSFMLLFMVLLLLLLLVVSLKGSPRSDVGVPRMLPRERGLPLPRELPVLRGENTEPMVSATERRVPPLFFFFRDGRFGGASVVGEVVVGRARFCMLLLGLTRLGGSVE